MKANTFKLKKFKATRVYGFKNIPKSSNRFAPETPTYNTTGILL